MSSVGASTFCASTEYTVTAHPDGASAAGQVTSIASNRPLASTEVGALATPQGTAYAVSDDVVI